MSWMGVPARASALRKRQRAQLVDQILDAVEEVALEAGIGGITIAAVAARAGVAVGTIYNYFPNGEGMVTALFRARRAQLLPAIDGAVRVSKALPFEKRLRAFMAQLLTGLDPFQRFLRVATLVDRDGSKCKPRDTATMDAIVDALDDIMRQGSREKRYPAGRAAIYARMLHGAFRAMFTWRLSEGGSITADSDLLVNTFLHGIGG
jgi:AcrR family transcriptional regulator